MNIRFIRSKCGKLLDWMYEVVCPHLPLQRKIVFDNFGGRGMGDDPKYIALYIKENYPDIKLIWLLADMNTPMPDGITPVFIYSRNARYHLYTAKIWVDNIKSFRKTPKRKGQFYLQTWHGGIAVLKKQEAQVERSLSANYVQMAKYDASITDLMYSDNDFTKSVFEKYFWYHGKVMKCDLPRISPFLNPPKDLKNQVYSYYNLSQEKKIVLYAPTWRSVSGVSIFNWDYEKILNDLSDKFGGDFVMLLRLHPNFAHLSQKICYSNQVIAASDYPDVQELLVVSDILITDYSSCMFEFGLTQKPVFLFAPDYDSYNEERGLVFDLKELPFNLSRTESELCINIQNFRKEQYLNNLHSFYKWIGYCDSGEGARLLSNILKEKL